MRYDDHHEAWEMKPRKLSTEEIGNPEKVIDAFFEITHLPQVRSCMWEMMKTLVTGSFADLKSRERARLINFYEQIEKLVEVVHVVHERNNLLKSAPAKVSD